MWKWLQPISEEIFNKKYKFHRKNIEEVFDNIAEVASSNEKNKEKYKKEFYDIFINKKFFPAGRIISNAWFGSKINNFGNCFTIGIEDSIDGIYSALKKDASISRVGGGVGFDVSTLRPEKTRLSTGGEASGPISFLKVFNQSAKIILSGGSRRSAHIALMDISHPDIEKFIEAKREKGVLTQFNLSVKLTNKFIKAVEKDLDWNLVFDNKIYKVIKARDLYNKLVENAWKYSDPGIFNIDIVNKYNNGWYLGNIEQCNPCGEEPLPVYKEYNNYGSVCNLGSIFLPSFVINPFEDDANFDFKSFKKSINTAIRFMDDIIDISKYPAKEINEIMENERRIGLGFTGFGDMLAMLKIKYGSEESKEFAKLIGKYLRDQSYTTSIELAKEKGKFPWFDERFLESKFIKKLPKTIREEIKKYGIRNITLNMIAPSGCLTKDARIKTSKANLSVEEIFKTNGYDINKIKNNNGSWYKVGKEIKVETIYGYKKITNLFVNGKKEILEIKTKNSSISATFNHRILVKINKNEAFWKRLDELQIGDKILIQKLDSGKSIYIQSRIDEIIRIDDSKFLEEEILSINKKEDYTFDIEIEQDHHYILDNGIISHNTTSLSLGQNCSSGIEPIFSLSYYRKVLKENNKDTFEEKVYDYAWLLYISKKLNLPIEEAYKADTSDIKVPDYFVSTIDVDPKDAIDIQSNLQQYIDASISKTHTLKPGTTLEEYKDLFLYAYKKELKGFTTFNSDYRDGVINYNNDDKQSIIRQNAPKRPKDLQCDIHEISVLGKKFIVLIGKLNGSLYEVFVDCNDDNKVDVGKHKIGIIRKQSKGKYDLIIANGEEKIIVENISKSFDPTYGTLARLISVALRHGVPLQFLVSQISKSNNFLGFERAVNRVLKKYIKKGEKVVTSDKCPECKGDLIYQDGCKVCLSCGWSACE